MSQKVKPKKKVLLSSGIEHRCVRDLLDLICAAENVGVVSVEKYNDLRDAFIDYACSGAPSPAPWCKNRNGMCTNGWGHCLPESGNCQGFNPDGEKRQDGDL